jgi:hypothetical protein
MKGVALALIALGLFGCLPERVSEEVIPEAAGAVRSVSGTEGGIQTFELADGTSVTIHPALLDSLESPGQGYDTTALVLWGHQVNGREWIIATESPISVPGVPGDCYVVRLLARRAGNDVLFYRDVGQSKPAPILGIRVKRAANSGPMDARDNGEYPAKFICLNDRGEVSSQP